MGKDFDNPWGKTTKKGNPIKMSALLNSGVFPGMQGGPLEHVIAAKAIAFHEALQPEFKAYGKQVIKNAKAMAAAFIQKGYKVISGGTDNHLMLIDLRSKGITIDLHDLYIAATAKMLNLPLLTRNIKHFENIMGLEVIKWPFV